MKAFHWLILFWLAVITASVAFVVEDSLNDGTPPPTTTTTAAPTTTSTTTVKPVMTEQAIATSAARWSLDAWLWNSRDGLIEEMGIYFPALEQAVIVAAVDSLGVDWFAQAVIAADASFEDKKSRKDAERDILHWGFKQAHADHALNIVYGWQA